MHPNRAFHWEDREAMRGLVADIGFGTLFAATPDGPRTVHLPVVIEGDTLSFHVARGNALARHLHGATALFSLLGPDAYVSPDWYGLGSDQVPTWNYLAVELEGPVRRLDEKALLAQIDALAEQHERRIMDKQPWTRANADTAYVNRLLAGITGFALDITAWRGTMKLAQNKPVEARLAVADALESEGRRAMAHLMRSLVLSEDKA
jgi:transcriptional regulator